ncbi:DUF6241 domain-containing protein [Sporolactobacillus shoreicorticis]|uniref:DUF6241 domain-containing protein n=1 Tax=Sporolactobacillus shoreicorticis TaxID=1923877 RepID=A0ABW5S5V3_9BACL|nr:DUF6241 domain-containing protein [Sporolactobacillus shoreicorticis]MCO7128171.1 DUF6241 domain-containing protein [Sporolactobacillus shoreicorticis]
MIFAVIGGAGYHFYQKQQHNELHQQTAEKMIEKINRADLNDKKNPFGENKKINDLTDDDMQLFIHEMTHQKVKADQKWGFILMTQNRIDWLYRALKKNTFTYEKTYHTILNCWENGDFSKAVQDQNAIWKIQGGTIGKATGLLAASEERQYIEAQNKK